MKKNFNVKELLNYPLVLNKKDIISYTGYSSSKVEKMCKEKHFNALNLGIKKILIYRDDFAKFIDYKLVGLNFYQNYINEISKEGQL